MLTLCAREITRALETPIGDAVRRTDVQARCDAAAIAPLLLDARPAMPAVRRDDRARILLHEHN